MSKSVFTKEEEKELYSLEEKINKGKTKVQEGFVEIGESLTEIKEKKLYRIHGETFGIYTQNTFGFTEKRAYQFILGVKILSNLSTRVDILPVNEKQTRALNNLTADQMEEVWKALLEENNNNPKKITAKAVKDKVKEVLPPKESQEQKDRTLEAVRKFQENVLLSNPRAEFEAKKLGIELGGQSEQNQASVEKEKKEEFITLPTHENNENKNDDRELKTFSGFNCEIPAKEKNYVKTSSNYNEKGEYVIGRDLLPDQHFKPTSKLLGEDLFIPDIKKLSGYREIDAKIVCYQYKRIPPLATKTIVVTHPRTLEPIELTILLDQTSDTMLAVDIKKIMSLAKSREKEAHAKGDMSVQVGSGESNDPLYFTSPYSGDIIFRINLDHSKAHEMTPKQKKAYEKEQKKKRKENRWKRV